MGVSATTYTVFGVKVPYDSGLTDLAYSGDDPDAFDGLMVADGMSGEYIAIGAFLFNSEGPDEEFAAIDISDLPAKKAAVCEKFEELAPAYAHLLAGDWKLMTFVHYH